jgi:hypothetical protein
MAQNMLAFCYDTGIRNTNSIGAIIHPHNLSSSPPSCHGRQGAEPTGHLCQLSRLNAELLELVVTKTHPGRLRAGSRRVFGQ